jgi:hypothetical protein
VLGPLVDRALFRPGKRVTRTEVTTQARAGVVLFLAGYQANVSNRARPGRAGPES